jgi:hypothetical protein
LLKQKLEKKAKVDGDHDKPLSRKEEKAPAKEEPTTGEDFSSAPVPQLGAAVTGNKAASTKANSTKDNASVRAPSTHQSADLGSKEEADAMLGEVPHAPAVAGTDSADVDDDKKSGGLVSKFTEALKK